MCAKSGCAKIECVKKRCAKFEVERKLSELRYARYVLFTVNDIEDPVNTSVF